MKQSAAQAGIKHAQVHARNLTAPLLTQGSDSKVYKTCKVKGIHITDLRSALHSHDNSNYTVKTGTAALRSVQEAAEVTQHSGVFSASMLPSGGRVLTMQVDQYS